MNRQQPLNQPLDSNWPVTSTERVPAEFARGSGDYAEVLAEVIEAVGLGFILVAADGWILYANRMAYDLMRRGQGLRSSYGRLVTSRSEGAPRLADLSKIAAGPRVDAEPKSQVIALLRGEGEQHLFAHIVPTQPPVGGVAIFVVDPAHHLIPHLDAFASRYGLTPAESRVLSEIVSGQGLVAAARSLDIAQSTARTHLQRIFAKTGAGRQTELMHLYLTGVMPAVSAMTAELGPGADCLDPRRMGRQ